MEKEKIEYPVWSVRIDEEMKEWLKQESKKFKSWNLFFRELRKRYEERSTGPKENKAH